MTSKEQKMLEIAKEIIDMNSHLGAKLSGSLMLALMGINKRREANDIDIICDICHNDAPSARLSEDMILIPKGYKIISMSGYMSDIRAIRLANTDGVKVEFMERRGEPTREVKGVICADLNNLIAAKYEYSTYDDSEELREKHKLDLIYLKENNQGLTKYFENMNYYENI